MVKYLIDRNFKGDSFFLELSAKPVYHVEPVKKLKFRLQKRNDHESSHHWRSRIYWIASG